MPTRLVDWDPKKQHPATCFVVYVHLGIPTTNAEKGQGAMLDQGGIGSGGNKTVERS
jgi:hypothetical protein